jgi:predicted transcriptional regulator
MTSLTIPLDPDTDNALDEIAETTKRSKAQIVAEAVAAYVDYQAELEAMVREAREDFAAGRTFSHEEAMADARAIIEAAKARKA